MIYFATLIFTLLLSQIARAKPACGDAASPQDVYNASDHEQYPPAASYKVVWDYIYDYRGAYTNGVVCSNTNQLASNFPQFSKFPAFPYLGGAFDIKWGSPTCGQCWKLTNKKTSRSIFITAIDAVWPDWAGFNIGKVAFSDLNGGVAYTDPLDVEAVPVSKTPCVARS